MFRSGQLDKVYIQPFEKKDFSGRDQAKIFVLPMNPETYAQNLKVEYDTRRGHGQQGTDPRFDSTKPEELKLEFIFDGTDTLEGYYYNDKNEKTVKGQLKQFLKTVYHVEGNIHRPNFLIVYWGEYLAFPCILSQLDITYTLFESNGDPLRAKISATFLNHQPPNEREARQRNSSPDLTHHRLVSQADRLDLMTNKVYGSPKYTMQVARANGLTTIRRLLPGKELRFPPIDKNETA